MLFFSGDGSNSPKGLQYQLDVALFITSRKDSKRTLMMIMEMWLMMIMEHGDVVDPSK